MSRFNISIDPHFASLAARPISNERRVRKSVASIGANEKRIRSGAASHALLFNIATSLSMLTAATIFLAWRLGQFVH
jgi:hypothetical protein